jgi:hypothetical protein
MKTQNSQEPPPGWLEDALSMMELSAEVTSALAAAGNDEPDAARAHVYAPGVEINQAFAALHPNNCAVIERTGDGVSVGACTHYLRNGTDCPRHGRVKAHNDSSSATPGEKHG